MGIRERIKRVWRRGAPALERGLRAVPTVNRRLEARYEEMLVPLEASLKPYRGDYPAYSRLPEQGRDRAAILSEIEELKEREEARWRDGFVSGAVYHGDAEHIDFLNRVYALNSQSNPLHADVWPSAAKYEAEIVAMTADMLGGSHAAAGEPVCGTVSSGGTESILLAMKTYRDRARAERGITRPEKMCIRDRRWQ